MKRYLWLLSVVLVIGLLATGATTALAHRSGWHDRQPRPRLDIEKTVDSFFTFRERSDPGDPSTGTENLGLGMNGHIIVSNTSEVTAEFTKCIDLLALGDDGWDRAVYPDLYPGLRHLASLEPYVLQSGVFIWPDCEGYQLGPGQTETFGYVVKVDCRALGDEFTRLRNHIVIMVKGSFFPFFGRSEWQDLAALVPSCAGNGGVP